MSWCVRLMHGVLLLCITACASYNHCKDHDPQCSSWADSEQCTANPGFMRVSCPKSCKVCCTDDNPACRDWAVDGECVKNAGFMEHSCPCSCGLVRFEHDNYRVRFDLQLTDTTTGSFILEVHPDWAPRGAKRFKALLDSGFYEGSRFHFAVKGVSATFGVNGQGRDVQDVKARIEDDPLMESNTRGYVALGATLKLPLPKPPEIPEGYVNARTSLLTINFANNSMVLDQIGYAPFGKVVSGMDVVEQIYTGYGYKGPPMEQFLVAGNKFADNGWPLLSYVKSVQTLWGSGSDVEDELDEKDEL